MKISEPFDSRDDSRGDRGECAPIEAETGQGDRQFLQDGSVSGLILALQRGDRRAVEPLWKRFSVNLQRTAERRLRHGPPDGGFDAEDVALSAFGSFCAGAEQGKFADIQGRDELWRLLATIVRWKILDQRKGQTAQKRAGRRLPLEAIEPVVDSAATPEMAALIADETRRFVELLNDPLLEATALMMLSGRSTSEIALDIGLTQRTVQRMIRVIRSQWQIEKDRLTP